MKDIFIAKAKSVMMGFFLCALCHVSAAGESTYVYPHVVEQAGSVLDTAYTYDVVLDGFYSGEKTISRQKGAPVTVKVELYAVDNSVYFTDQPVLNALPLESDGGNVISAVYGLDRNNRVLHVRIEDLVKNQNNGTFIESNLFVGAMIITVSGEDKMFSFTANQINVLSGPQDFSVLTLERNQIK